MQAVDYIFRQCAATYGAAWDKSLGQSPITDTKTAWLNAVAPFRNSKKRIVWALENLPQRPPNPIEFRALCRVAPMPEVLALPEPAANPERVAAELAKLGHVRESVSMPHGGKQWAYTLQKRHQQGDRLNHNQIRCYKAALGIA